jgi:ATP-dependent DNA helicase RecG
MIKQCRKNNLPEPEFMQKMGHFITVLWKDIFTEKYLSGLGLSERQTKAVDYLKTHREITNSIYQIEFEASKRTASRDLDDMMTKGVVEKVGITGKGVHYRLGKGATKGPKRP